MSPEKQNDEPPMEVKRIDWSKAVFFVDVDGTLVNVDDARMEGSESIEKVINKHFPGKGREIRDGFNRIFELNLMGYLMKDEEGWQAFPQTKRDYDSLNERIDSMQSSLGIVKRYSRECYIAIASQDADIDLTPQILDETSDAYWKHFAKVSKPFEDAIEFTRAISEHGRPVYLTTSSDQRLRMRDDGQFEYDPEYSEETKRQLRIKPLRKMGFQFEKAIIGDPIDKPKVEFFLKAISVAESDMGSIELRNVISIGDSWDSDVRTPKEKLGFGLAVHNDRSTKESEVVDHNTIRTQDLKYVLNYLNES